MSTDTSGSPTVITQRPGQVIGGHAVGIIVLNVGYRVIPGNVANATTYRLPVRFKVVQGADIPGLLAGDRTLLAPSLRAAEEFVADSWRAIVGACGYFAKFQRELAESLPVPVIMSSLCQVPMILGSLRPSEQLGIVCASKPSLDAATLAAAGVAPDTPLVVYGLEESEEFRTSILEGKGWMDNAKVEAEVVGTAVRLAHENPRVRALLLECATCALCEVRSGCNRPAGLGLRHLDQLDLRGRREARVQGVHVNARWLRRSTPRNSGRPARLAA